MDWSLWLFRAWGASGVIVLIVLWVLGKPPFSWGRSKTKSFQSLRETPSAAVITGFAVKTWLETEFDPLKEGHKQLEQEVGDLHAKIPGPQRGTPFTNKAEELAKLWERITNLEALYRLYAKVDELETRQNMIHNEVGEIQKHISVAVGTHGTQNESIVRPCPAADIPYQSEKDKGQVKSGPPSIGERTGLPPPTRQRTGG